MNALNSGIRELSADDLDAVSGGGIKGAVEGVCKKDAGGQNDPAQMFQQILNQLTQGQG